MPRVKRRGHTKRDPEIPLSEWSLGELRAEHKRLEANPEGLNPWQAFKRGGELRNEIEHREMGS